MPEQSWAGKQVIASPELFSIKEIKITLPELKITFIILVSLFGNLISLNAQEEIKPVKNLPAPASMTSLPAYDLSNHKTVYPKVNRGYGVKIRCVPLNSDEAQFYVKVDKIDYEVDNDFFSQIHPDWISNISIFKSNSEWRVYFEFKKRKEKTILKLISRSRNLNQALQSP